MWKNLKAPRGREISVENERYDEIFADKFNIAAIVIKQDKIVYERYNAQRGSTTATLRFKGCPCKTAVGATVAGILCDGKYALHDPAGVYSPTLKSSPYANIKIKNILQMNSGVFLPGRDDEKRFNRKSRGVSEKYSGKASVREALSFYKKAARSQNSKMNYHSSDTLALSILVEEVSGKSPATVFHDKIYSNFGKDGYMHWTAGQAGNNRLFRGLDDDGERLG